MMTTDLSELTGPKKKWHELRNLVAVGLLDIEDEISKVYICIFSFKQCLERCLTELMAVVHFRCKWVRFL